MNKKRFARLWLRSQLPLLWAYLLLTALLALLCYLYQLPTIIIGDFVRFSLPVLIIWLIITVVRAHHRQQRVSKQELVSPNSPLEQALVSALTNERAHHRKLVQRLRHKQQEQLDQLDLFSHEIKNFLALLQAAAESKAAVSSPQVKASVHQTDYYLNLLLSGERLAMDKSDLDLKWLGLSKVVNEVVQENGQLFIAKQLIPAISISQVQVMTDQKWLHFCINQLLINAIKYADSATTIKISWQDNALTITDTGPAIPSTDLPRIFDNGFTGHNGHQTTRSTGMGLYFVKQVTDRLGLQVRVLSPGYRQTVAQLTFPDKLVH